jgi:hypothetical protein
MADICSTCHQPILPGEGRSCQADGTRYHLRAADCVAAVVRRFAEIVEAFETEWMDPIGCEAVAQEARDRITAAIRSEFPEVKS